VAVVNHPALQTALLSLLIAASPLAWGAPITFSIRAIGMTDAEHTREDGVRSSAGSFRNSAGQVAGTSTRYAPGQNLGTTAWLFDGTNTLNVGLTDAEHTRAVDGYRNSSLLLGYFNEAGQVAGYAERYGAGYTSLGRSVWLYDGTQTLNIGPTDAEHTNSSTGFRFSSNWGISDADHVAGVANRYDAGGATLGQTAWLYNGGATVNIGLTDAEHTIASSGFRFSQVGTLAAGINGAGQVTGYSRRYSAGGTDLGRTAWLYNGTSTVGIGLTDAEHTRSTDGARISDATILNEAGQVAGASNRYGSVGSDLGRTAWLYDGAATLNIGLTDAGHTRSTDGYRYAEGQFLNEAGQAAGYARRYNPGGAELGRSAWLYNGSGTVNIGLTDGEHTTVAGLRVSNVTFLNEAGQAAGYSTRHNAGSYGLGQSAWVYDGASTHKIGLTDAEHTRTTLNPETNGYRYSEVGRFNEAGQATGHSLRYGAGGTSLGNSAWLYDGTTTLNIGLTDALHTRSTDGYRYSAAQYLNDAGQVVGFGRRYGAGGADLGQTLWLYDGGVTITLDPLSQRSDGYAYSLAQWFGDDGDILGYYEAFGPGNVALGNRAFWYSDDYGLYDLGLLVDESFDDWYSLANAIAMSSDGLTIFGYGLLADMPSGQMPFVMTAASVPVPPAFLLFGSALALAAGVRRRAA